MESSCPTLEANAKPVPTYLKEHSFPINTAESLVNNDTAD